MAFEYGTDYYGYRKKFAVLVPSTNTAAGLLSCTVSLPPHAAPATPEDPECGCSFESLRQRPSPSDHRVGISNSLTRWHLGWRALRPAALPRGTFNL